MKQILMIIAVLGLGGCVAEGENDQGLDISEFIGPAATLPDCAAGVTDAGYGWMEFDCDEARILKSPTGGIAVIGPARFPWPSESSLRY